MIQLLKVLQCKATCQLCFQTCLHQFQYELVSKHGVYTPTGKTSTVLTSDVDI